MGIAFIPLYIDYLGMAAYGLIGVLSILQACLALLDVGIAPTLNREMARYSAGVNSRASICNLFRSFELMAMFIALISGVAVLVSASWLSTNWFKAANLTQSEVEDAILIMGLIVSLRLLEGVYKAAILGLQHHVFYNIANSVLATLRNAGVIAVLAFVSPTIKVFFYWHVFVSIISVFVFAAASYRSIYMPIFLARFSLVEIRRVWRFSGSVMLATLLSILMLQTDKVLLSRLLSLELYGVYAFASSVCAVIYLIASPVAQSFSPRLTELVAKNNSASVAIVYQQASQLLSVIVIPVVLMLFFFGERLVFLWTGNKLLAAESSQLIRFVSLGCGINALMYAPYMLQLANGTTRLAILLNAISVLAFVPAIFFVAPVYGAFGAAVVWFVLNIFYMIFTIELTHHYFLKQERLTWYVNGLLCPVLVVCVFYLLCFGLVPQNTSRLVELILLAIILFGAGFVAILSTKKMRSLFIYWVGCFVNKSLSRLTR